MDAMSILRDHGFGGGSGTAQASDVRAGKTYTSSQGFHTGALADRGNGPTVTPGASAQTFAAGIYNTLITVQGDANLVSANIKANTNIFGVAGKSTVVDTADASAGSLSGNVLSGTTVYGQGTKYVGTIPWKNPIITPSTVDQPLSGYYYDVAKVSGDGNLVAGNIKSGVTIFGVAGNVVPGTQWASGNVNVGASQVGFTTSGSGSPVMMWYLQVSGLSFTPTTIIIYNRTFSSSNFTMYKQGYGYKPSTTVFEIFLNQAGGNSYVQNNTQNASVSGGSFTMPVYNTGSTDWFAFAN